MPRAEYSQITNVLTGQAESGMRQETQAASSLVPVQFNGEAFTFLGTVPQRSGVVSPGELHSQDEPAPARPRASTVLGAQPPAGALFEARMQLPEGMQAVETGSGLLAISQPEVPGSDPRIDETAALSSHLLPKDHQILRDESSGLVIVSKIKQTKLTEAEADDMPDPQPENTIVLPTKREGVDLSVWMATPDGALWSLATETGNTTALDLVEAAKTEKRIVKQVMERRENDDTKARVVGELTAKWAQRLQKQDFTQEERLEIAALDNAFPTDLSNGKLKLTLSDELAQRFPKDDYTQEQKRQKQEEMDAFFAAAITDSSELFGIKSGAGVTSRLTHLADLLRYQTKSIQLQGDKTVEAVAELAASKGLISSDMLGFLTRFDIPASLAAELLATMEKTSQLNHPLALHLMDKLPKNHPFKQEQQARVDRLTNLLTGDISNNDIFEALQLRDGIVSVYINPDRDPERDKMGLEFENFPRVQGITVPEGTTMGQDLDQQDHIPELRLDNKDNVLMYGKQWRERYYNLFLWTTLSQAEQRSLHIHVNKTEKTSAEAFHLLFGFEDDLARQNPLGTMEIRSPLADYKNEDLKELGIVGYSSVFMPELVDLIYSLRSVPVPPKIDLSDLLNDRFTLFTKAVADPTSRAAMFIALRGEAGQRVQNPHTVYEVVSKNNYAYGVWSLEGRVDMFNTPSQEKLVDGALKSDSAEIHLTLVRNINLLDESLHEKVVIPMLASGDKDVIYELVLKIGALKNPELQRLVAGMTIAKGDHKTMVALAEHINSIQNSEVQSKTAKTILEQGVIETVNKLVANIGSLDPQMQRDVIKDTLDTTKSTVMVTLSSVLHALDPEVLEEFVTETLEKGDKHRVTILGSHIGKLDKAYQQKYLRWVEKKQNSIGYVLLGNAVAEIDESLRQDVADSVIASQNKHALEGLAATIRIFDPITQEKIIDNAQSTKSWNATNVLGFSIESVDPSLRGKVVDNVIANKSHALLNLAGSLVDLDEQSQKKVADAAYATKNVEVIRALLTEIDAADITLQKQYVDWAKGTNDFQEIILIGEHFVSFHPSLRKTIYAYASDTMNVPFFHELAKQIESIDPEYQEDVVSIVADYGDDDAIYDLGEKFHLLTPRSRALLAPALAKYSPTTYRAVNANVKGWEYKQAA